MLLHKKSNTYMLLEFVTADILLKLKFKLWNLKQPLLIVKLQSNVFDNDCLFGC